MAGWFDWLLDPFGLPPELCERLAHFLAPHGFVPANHAPGRITWRGEPDGVPISIQATRGSLGVRVARSPAGFHDVRRRTNLDDALLGDPPFDAVVTVLGPDRARVLRVLGPSERDLLHQAVVDGWRLRDGAWVMTHSQPDTADLTRIVERAIALGKLGQSPDPPGSGLDARLADPQRGVRTTALAVLLANRRWANEWRGLLASSDPRTVLAAAVALRDGDTLRTLGRHIDPDIACDAWLTLLTLGHPIAADHFEPPLFRVLDAARHPAHETPLVSPEISDRWERILAALAKYGSPAAIARLESRPELVLPLVVRRQIRATIGAIRERHAPDRGSLALADAGTTGRVSLADPPGKT